MTIAGIRLDFTSPQEFGHAASQFHRLIAFMTSLSWILWAVVLLTVLVRFVACHVLYRDRRSTARAMAEAAVPGNDQT
jgi:heme/copper-type cytochrome/quinol oxidase subunit 2